MIILYYTETDSLVHSILSYFKIDTISFHFIGMKLSRILNFYKEIFTKRSLVVNY